MASSRAVANRTRDAAGFERARMALVRGGHQHVTDVPRPGPSRSRGPARRHHRRGAASFTYAGARTLDELAERATVGIQSAPATTRGARYTPAGNSQLVTGVSPSVSEAPAGGTLPIDERPGPRACVDAPVDPAVARPRRGRRGSGAGRAGVAAGAGPAHRRGAHGVRGARPCGAGATSRWTRSVLDVAMPGLSGLDLARVLARFSHPPPVVFVTATTSTRSRRSSCARSTTCSSRCARTGWPRRYAGSCEARSPSTAASAMRRTTRRSRSSSAA